MTPKDYDELERQAIDRLPNRIVAACSTVAFDKVGYPTRVSSSEGLWRFADTMQEFRLQSIFERLGGLTSHEFELIEKLTATVKNLTSGKIVPTASLLSGVGLYRAITQLHPGGTVFEVGGGSGYTGAMLLLDGYDYWATDIAQGFFLWQSLLFNGSAHMIPWWDWMTMTELPAIDVFVVNHALNEMHVHALLYAVKTAKKMLKPGGRMLTEDYGSPVLRSCEDTANLCRQAGLDPVCVHAHLDNPDKTMKDLENLWGDTKSPDEKFLEGLMIGSGVPMV